MESKKLLESYKEELVCVLNADLELGKMVDGILIESRYKSRFSTMKKLLKDGRKPEEVNDILGLRVILDTSSDRWAAQACYRTHEVIRSIWREVAERTKDYITRPKGNGYRSLHVAVDVGEGAEGLSRPLMEVQIRTAEMHLVAIGGAAAHSMYKGGLTDPEEAKQLKAIMVAAAEVAAVRLRELGMGCRERKGMLCLLDKNMDGRISIEELTPSGLHRSDTLSVIRPHRSVTCHMGCFNGPSHSINFLWIKTNLVDVQYDSGPSQNYAHYLDCLLDRKTYFHIWAISASYEVQFG